VTVRINCTIVDGLVPNEKIAQIRRADGKIEEVEVPVQSTEGSDRLLASEIGKRDNDVLIELPRESTSGRWRVWVNASLVL
jgi:hypothetical protein